MERVLSCRTQRIIVAFVSNHQMVTVVECSPIRTTARYDAVPNQWIAGETYHSSIVIPSIYRVGHWEDSDDGRSRVVASLVEMLQALNVFENEGPTTDRNVPHLHDSVKGDLSVHRIASILTFATPFLCPVKMRLRSSCSLPDPSYHAQQKTWSSPSTKMSCLRTRSPLSVQTEISGPRQSMTVPVVSLMRAHC